MDETILGLAAQLVSSYVGNNSISTDQLPALIKVVHQTLAAVDTPLPEEANAQPAVEVRKSVFGDHLVCLACGASYKTLKRHLGSEHQLTPEAYRTRYNLPSTYPVVAPDYAKARSVLAREIGLGRGGRSRKRKTKGKRY